MTSGGRFLVGLLHAHGDIAVFGRLLERLSEARDSREARRVARTANVEREARAGGDDIDGAWKHVRAADRRDEIFGLLRSALDLQHHLRRGTKCVPAQIHRHGTRMARYAIDFDREATRSVNRGDDADWQAFSLQHRALLDMQLAVGQYLVPAAPNFGNLQRV